MELRSQRCCGSDTRNSQPTNVLSRTENETTGERLKSDALESRERFERTSPEGIPGCEVGCRGRSLREVECENRHIIKRKYPSRLRMTIRHAPASFSSTRNQKNGETIDTCQFLFDNNENNAITPKTRPRRIPLWRRGQE